MSGAEERKEDLLFAIEEAEQGRTEYLRGELCVARPMPDQLRLWLADVLDPEGESGFAVRLTRRVGRPRGRPKATAPKTDRMARPRRFADLLLKRLRANELIAPFVRLRLARWFDPEARTFVRATIRRRRAGAPSRPTRGMVHAAYHVVVNIDPGAKLEALLATAIEKHSEPGEPKISRSKLIARLGAHWPDLFPKARAARRSRKKIE